MQIKLKLGSDVRINLPIANQHALQSMIYNAIRTCPSYSRFLHDSGMSDGEDSLFKLFTFGKLRGTYTVVRKYIIYEGPVWFEIRCTDPFMCQLLLESFKYGSELQILRNKVKVLSCRLENRVVFEDRIKVNMLSPVTQKTKTPDRKTVYFAPDEDIFYEKIIDNARRKWISKFGDDCEYRKLITTFKETYINAWFGQFILSGNPKTLDFLYNTGIGSKNSQGFGMFEITD